MGGQNEIGRGKMEQDRTGETKMEETRKQRKTTIGTHATETLTRVMPRCLEVRAPSCVDVVDLCIVYTPLKVT